MILALLIQQEWFISVLLMQVNAPENDKWELDQINESMLNANKHIHLAVGVEHAALDTHGKSLHGVPSTFPCYVSQASPSFTQTNAVQQP